MKLVEKIQTEIDRLDNEEVVVLFSEIRKLIRFNPSENSYKNILNMIDTDELKPYEKLIALKKIKNQVKR